MGEGGTGRMDADYGAASTEIGANTNTCVGVSTDLAAPGEPKANTELVGAGGMVNAGCGPSTEMVASGGMGIDSKAGGNTDAREKQGPCSFPLLELTQSVSGRIATHSHESIVQPDTANV